MPSIEIAAIALGTAVAKAACGVWLGDHKVAAEMSASAIDIASKGVTSARSERKFRRMWEQAAELIADQLEPVIERQYQQLPENERLAAIDAVRDTFDRVALAEEDIFAQDLDAAFLDRYVRSQDPARARLAGLSTHATRLYDFLLRECCAYTIDVARTLPQGGMHALAEILQRDRQILEDVRTMLERLPARRGVSDFERDYRQLIVHRLDQVKFFGVTTSESNRRYPLSVAYLSLRVSGEFTLQQPKSLLPDPSSPTWTPMASTRSTARIEDVLASSKRIFVRGQAGLGKTTLLQWIAAQSARSTFPERLADWNDTIPFFVSLRQHAAGKLPPPEKFLAEIGRHIADEKPPGWVHRQLRLGRGIVLVDGVDELPEQRRDDVRIWLEELIASFPASRFVITSRPAAVPNDWLGHEDFDVAELEPMSATDVPIFVHRWHQAMQKWCVKPADRESLEEYSHRLLDSLGTHVHLRTLAGYPLLCALLCALHRDRRGELPDNRMELYEVALQMLLERRDSERRLDIHPTKLSRTSSNLLLRDIAYWLIRNDRSSADTGRVITRIRTKIKAMPQITVNADEVYRVLLERSGLLREPIEGQTDFIHRSFQEYLAAAEAVASDDLGLLILNAHRDMWTDVVVMASGHASTARRAELLRGILDRADLESSPPVRDVLRLLTLACLEVSPELPPDLRSQVERAAATLLPPRTMAAARSLSRAGTFTLDLLCRSQPKSAEETTASIRAVADIGDPAGIPFLARFGRDGRRTVIREILRAWPRFDPENYAKAVLRDCPLDGGSLDLTEARLTQSLSHLTRLRTLYCDYEDSPDGLSFLTRVPQLKNLTTQDRSIRSLAPVADSRLSSISLNNGGADDDPLSLAPLERATAVSSVHIWSRPVTDVGALAKLPSIRAVRLDYLMELDSLAELSALTDLDELGIGHIKDLNNLRPLSFLQRPRSIGINSCSVSDDLSYLDRWAGTLESLSLRGLDNADLGLVAGLRNLSFLDIQGSKAIRLASLRNLDNLTTIWLSHGGVDLGELAAIKSLRQIGISGDLDPPAALDLTPLANSRNLLIRVRRTTTVHHADLLGPGSRVRRW